MSSKSQPIEEEVVGEVQQAILSIETLLNEAKEDAIKIDSKGNKAAGTRLRATLQQIKKEAQDLRIKIQEDKNKAA